MGISIKIKCISIAALCCLLISCKQVIIQQPQTKVVTEDPSGISTGTVFHLLWLSLIIALGFIVLVFVFAQVGYKLERNSLKRFCDGLEGHLSQIFGLTWLFGFGVYSVGMFV